uniref:Acetylcholine receptor subunit alpha-type acr-16 n=1 Tax=Syphacia muris TaxID=451379 RepID=A0A0N5AFW2_9BILA
MNYTINLLIFCCWNVCWINGSDDENRLYTDLLTNYNSLERPVNNASQALVVKMKLYLQSVVDVDEKNQIVQINAWQKYVWQDYKLKWDPNEYGGIKIVRFPGSADHVWKPDILLYNSADENFDSTFKSNVVAYNNGDVQWIPPGLLKFSCKMDITWFPFDDQVCILKFGSWTYHGAALDLVIDKEGSNETHSMDLSDYVENGEWNLMATPAVREVKYYKCCPEPYISLLFTMHLRRRTLYYGFNLIIPSLLISLMTILGFTLPPDAGEKITLEITILLSVCFFLSMVAEMTPPTSEAIPLLGVFFSCCMLVVSTSVVFTIVVLNLHFRNPDTHIMTPLIRKILLEWLPWILMMSRPGVKFSKGKSFQQFNSFVKQTEPEINDTENVSMDNPKGLEIILLRRVYSEVKEITERMKDEEENEKLQNDWKFAAVVVDRACLICFSIFITISACGIIFSAPHLTA